MSHGLYLSRLLLDLRSQRVQRELGDLYEMHRTVMAAFPDGCRGAGERVLFRVDPLRGRAEAALLVQSRVEPDWTFLAHRPGARGYLAVGAGDNPAVKRYTLSLRLGQNLAFRLLANPTVKRAGKRLGLLREEDQRAWLARKLAAAGAELLSCRAVSLGLQRSERNPAKDREVQTHLAVLFDGALYVRDGERLAAAVAEGIGAAKGYGFGLLSLARVS